VSNTPNLGLTLMSASQAQKDTVFNNLAIAFDALFKGSVISAAVTTPPASPAVGDAYIVPAGATGWPVGHDDNVAFYFNGWQYIAPPLKLRLYDVATGRFMTYQGPSTHWTNDPLSTVSVLGDLTNVTGSPADGQVLTFIAVDGHWEPRTPAFTGPLSGLSDVQVSEGAPIDGMALTWNNTDHKWEPSAFVKTIPPVTFLGLSDVSYAGASSGWVLVYNETGPGAHFVAINTLETVSSLDQVGDVAYPTGGVGAIPSGAYLRWNGAAWVPSTSAVAYSWEGISDGPGAMAGKAGYLVRVNALEDAIEYVSPAAALGTSFKLMDLLDVTAAEASGDDGKVLTWVQSASRWEPLPPPSGVTTLAGLSDVSVSEDVGHDGDVLAWHNATSRWVPLGLAPVAVSGHYGDLTGAPSLAEVALSGAYADLTGKPTIITALANLSDVTIAEGAGIDGYSLVWDNTAGHWGPRLVTGGASAFTSLSDVPAAYTGAGGKFVKVNSGGTGLEFVAATVTTALSALTDVSITSAAAQDELYYDGTASRWKNRPTPYNLSASITGLMIGGEILLQYVFPEAVTFKSGLTGSYAKSNTAATASTTVLIQKNGAAIGSMAWAGSGTSATFTFSSDVAFAAGDILQLVAPGTADGTLADIGITLAGVRS